MYNHRNGKFLNTEVTTEFDEKHVTKASRDIKPGEQIHNSYNNCKECIGRKVGYGTAGAYHTHSKDNTSPPKYVC